VLGGLFFGHAETGVFTERAERIVAGIAAQSAIAIDNARLYQSLQTELEDSKLLQQLGAQLIHEDDVLALYEKVVDAARSVMRSAALSSRVMRSRSAMKASSV